MLAYLIAQYCFVIIIHWYYCLFCIFLKLDWSRFYMPLFRWSHLLLVFIISTADMSVYADFCRMANSELISLFWPTTSHSIISRCCGLFFWVKKYTSMSVLSTVQILIRFASVSLAHSVSDKWSAYQLTSWLVAFECLSGRHLYIWLQ